MASDQQHRTDRLSKEASDDIEEVEYEDEAQETFSSALDGLCRPPKAKLRDPHSIRTAAAAAALIETIREKMADCSEAAVFTAALAAFTATCAAATTSESPQQPLLEILRRVIPFVAVSNPNLFMAQFTTLARALKAVIASIPSASSVMVAEYDNKTHGQRDSLIGGWNSLLRHCIRTAATAIIASIHQGTAAAHLEKEVLASFQYSILQHLDDPRPKVRREANAAIIDILQVSFTIATMTEQKQPLATTITHHVTRYMHHRLDTSTNTAQFQERETKILHTLPLMERTLLYLPHHLKYQLWQDVVQLVIFVISTYNTANGARKSHKEKISTGLVAHAALEVLGHSVEGLLTGATRDGLQDSNSTDSTLLFTNHMTKSLASLLQLNTTMVAFSSMTRTNLNDPHADCLILYARCIVSIMDSLVKAIPSLPENLMEEMEKTRTTMMQLLPVCFSSFIHCLEEEYNQHNHPGQQSLLLTTQGLSAELGRLVRIIPYLFTTYFDCVHENKHRQSILECISHMQKILSLHQLRHCWSMLLSTLAGLLVIVTQGVVSVDTVLIDKVQEDIMKQMVQPTLRLFVQLYKSLRDPHSKASLEQALKEVIHGIGIELFLNMVPLTGDLDEDTTDGFSDHKNNNSKKKKREKNSISAGLIGNDRVWILGILKSSSSPLTQSMHGVHSLVYRPRLALFTTTILSWARASDKASAIPNLTTAEVSIHRTRVIDTWSLLPCFCFAPIDLESSLPSLAQILVKAMGDVRYPELVTIICSSLKIMVETTLQYGFYDRCKRDESILESNRNVLSEVSSILLPAMFKLVETLNEKIITNTKAGEKETPMDLDESDEENRGKEDTAKWSHNLQRAAVVTDAITAFSTIAPRPTVQNLFKKVLQRLLIAAQSHDDETESLCAMLGLAQALVRACVLDDESISLLYRSIRPLIRSDEQSSRVQKRAYKVMAEICEHYISFITNNERLVEMTELFVNSALTLHVPSRLTRLKCMMFVVKNLDNAKPKHMAVISEIMGEVLLCLKDANSKTRDSAYHLLIEMANVQDDFSVFIKIILAALGAQTPHMRSAAVMALSRIVFEFAKVNETVHSYLPSLLQTVLVLFNDNAREVVKAVIGFVRVVIANLSRDQLEPLLPEIVEGLMKYNKGKGRFRSKIKIILKKLVQYFGYEVITPLVPGDDSRLITHIRKLSERAARKKSSAVQDSRKENVDYRFDDMMSSDEYDSDNGRTLMTGATGLTRKAKTGTVVGSNMSRSIAPSMKSFRTKATVAGPFIGVGNEKDGEVIDLLDSRSHVKVGYPDHDENSDFSDGDDDDLMMFDDGGKLVIREYGDKVEENTVTKDTEDDESRVIMAGQSIKKQRVSKYQSAKIDRDDRKQIALSTKRSAKDLGLAYKSNKAGGDVKRKDQKYEPYAYVPLDGKRYTKKNRDLAIAEMATVVRSKKRKNR